MSGWAQIAAAAAGGGGGGGGVTLNLNEIITPIGSEIMDHLNESYTVTRPDTAQSFFPAAWSRDVFDQILGADDVQVQWANNLEWSMKEDTYVPFDEMTHKLICNFQTVYLPPDPDIQGAENGLYLLHNVQPYAECSDAGFGWDVHVTISFGQPYPAGGGVIGVPVHYHVDSKESDGDQFRNITRSFAIQGDGQKHPIS